MIQSRYSWQEIRQSIVSVVGPSLRTYSFAPIPPSSGVDRSLNGPSSEQTFRCIDDEGKTAQKNADKEHTHAL